MKGWFYRSTKGRCYVALMICFVVVAYNILRGSNRSINGETEETIVVGGQRETLQKETVPSNRVNGQDSANEITWPRKANTMNHEPNHGNGPRNKQNGILRYHNVSGLPYSVTYDERSFIIDNKRTIILSGSVHYPRSTPGMWDHIFEEMVNDGLNAVQLYVFWNVHEFKRGQEYDFTGPANLPLFIEKAAKVGLFVNLRIGPYVCAEWNYGGLPVWLNFIPGMSLRSDNSAWKKEMERFVTDIAKIVEKYLARNGGPVILAQIENEYGRDMPYVQWCGELVAKLNLGIPWVMCNGLSAKNTIKTYNGINGMKYTSSHTKNSRFSSQPLVWTENQGWYQTWHMNEEIYAWSHRRPEVMAYVVLTWFARGGCHHNYYMWYGGNHMGRSAAMGLTNKYEDGANLHSDMLPNEPKRTHLTRLHKLIGDISGILLASKIQANNPIYLQYYNGNTKKFEKGSEQMAFVYDNDAGQIVFVQNSASVEVTVMYNHVSITMQPMSIIVLDKALSILYDSSKVNSIGLRTKRVYIRDKVRMNPLSAWSESVEEIVKDAVIEQHPLEQLRVTQDETDYLFYQTEVTIPVVEKLDLTVESRKANSLLIFTNERYEGSVDTHGNTFGNMSLTLNIHPKNKFFKLTILSVCLGLSNVIQLNFIEQKGIVGKVLLNEVDITHQKWLHRPKLTGEILRVYTDDGSKQVNWDSDYTKYTNTSLTWFKTTFTVERYSEDYSLLLHLVGFGRGHFYVNGVDLGRYWLIRMVKSLKYVQEYYFIPPDVVSYDGPNLLVIGEELGAPDPSKATLVLSTMTV